MKVIATIEARMSSSRLPGKVLRPILGKPMLRHLVERVKKASHIDQIVIATSDQADDDPIEDLAERAKVGIYRGSLDDVLGRVLAAAETYKTHAIVKLSGDNPLYDRLMIEGITEFYLENDFDFVSTTAMGFSREWKEERTFPLGTGISVFSIALLREIERKTRGNKRERESPVYHIIDHPGSYKLGAFHARGRFAAYKRPELRFTVDTPEDFALIEKIFENLYPQNPDFTLEEAIAFMDANKGIESVNSSVRQKGLVK